MMKQGGILVVCLALGGCAGGMSVGANPFAPAPPPPSNPHPNTPQDDDARAAKREADMQAIRDRGDQQAAVNSAASQALAVQAANDRAERDRQDAVAQAKANDDRQRSQCADSRPARERARYIKAKCKVAKRTTKTEKQIGTDPMTGNVHEVMVETAWTASRTCPASAPKDIAGTMVLTWNYRQEVDQDFFGEGPDDAPCASYDAETK